MSFRLKQLIKYIYPYRSIADVGCDHGYLIKLAFEDSLIDYALAIDNKIGPLNSAKNNLREFNNITFSLSNGISELQNNIEVLIIAGLGGFNIIDIIDNNVEKLENVKRIILQPNRNHFELRKFMNQIGYKIIEEDLFSEKEVFYEILIYEKGRESLSDLDLKFGPINRKNKNEHFKNKWMHYLRTLENSSKEDEISIVKKEIGL